MRLTQIRDFLAVVERGGIRAAARQLGVSQPTITKSVRGLEDELGVQLLGRNSRGVVLTASGRAFFSHARAAHAELRKAEEEATEVGGAHTGSVAFGVGNLGIALIVPQAVADFRRQFPRAHLRIVEGLAHLLLPSLRDETLDFVLGMRPATGFEPSLRFRPLYRTELVVAARKGHPLNRARSLVDLATADWLSTSTLGLPGGPFERLFTTSGLAPPRQLIQCDSYYAVAALLAKTDMLGVIQRRTLQDPFARRFLRELRIAEPIPTVTAGIFTRADTPLTQVGASMVKCATAAARRLARGPAPSA